MRHCRHGFANTAFSDADRLIGEILKFFSKTDPDRSNDIMSQKIVEDTEKLARQIRLYILEMLQNLGFGHIGGSLSVSDVLAVLYGRVMRYDPKNPHKEDRDYFVLSKGHGGPALYSTLALMGFFPKEELLTINTIGTNFPSHADRLRTPGVDATTGSLGQGFSEAAGLAAAALLNGKGQKVYCIVGDGELQEGQCWEAIQQIAHAKYSHFTLIVDDNGLQLDGPLNTICSSFNLGKKIEAFGWHTLCIDGHDHKAILEALTTEVKDKPKAVILKTQKGFGVPKLVELGSHHWKKGGKDGSDEAIAEAVEQMKKEVEGIK